MAEVAARSERRVIPHELIEDARKHVYEAAVRTPLVRLNHSKAAAEIYLKLENLQPIGSFQDSRRLQRCAFAARRAARRWSLDG